MRSSADPTESAGCPSEMKGLYEPIDEIRVINPHGTNVAHDAFDF